MPGADDPFAPLLAELDRLEDVLEELRDLGVASISEIEERIAQLNAEIDRLEAE